MPTITTGVVYQGETLTFSTFAVPTGTINLFSIAVPEYGVTGYDIQLLVRPRDAANPYKNRTVGIIYRGTGNAVNSLNVTSETTYPAGISTSVSGAVVIFKIYNLPGNSRFCGTCRVTSTKQEWSV